MTLKTPVSVVVWSVVTGMYLISLTFWLPGILLSFDGSSLFFRASICMMLIGSAGLLMGYGFPTEMRLVTSAHDRQKSWFWGINGASGVLASALAVACSIAYGIDMTLILGALCYLLLIPAALALAAATREIK